MENIERVFKDNFQAYNKSEIKEIQKLVHEYKISCERLFFWLHHGAETEEEHEAVRDNPITVKTINAYIDGLTLAFQEYEEEQDRLVAENGEESAFGHDKNFSDLVSKGFY